MTPSKTAFSESDLVELEWVFQSVCSALDREKAFPDEDDKAAIRRRLFVLACNGMNDPEMIAKHLVQSFLRHSGRGSFLLGT